MNKPIVITQISNYDNDTSKTWFLMFMIIRRELDIVPDVSITYVDGPAIKAQSFDDLPELTNSQRRFMYSYCRLIDDLR